MIQLPADARVNVVTLYTWLPAGQLHVNMGFYADPLSVTWILLVTGVGSLIHLYSIGYMHGDPRYSRFFAYLNLFAASMLDPRPRIELPRHVPRVGGRRAVLVPPRVVLVRAQLRRRRREEGVRHQPRGRRRLPARDVPDLRVVPHTRLHRARRRREGRLVGHGHRHRHSCCSRPRSGRARRSRCTSGCPTRWKAPRRCRR